jgi:hypothetical protein
MQEFILYIVKLLSRVRGWWSMEVVNIDSLIHKVEKVESELVAVKLELLKLKAERLPPEEVDEDTKKAFEEDIREFVEGRVETISGSEASKLLLSSLKE